MIKCMMGFMLLACLVPKALSFDLTYEEFLNSTPQK